MTDTQLDLLRKAAESLAAARSLLMGGYPGFAASRAYYSMFYAAEAFLEGEGLSFSSHKAVIGAFGKEFARTGRVPPELHRHLVDAEELRHLADYGPYGGIDAERATRHIEHAEQFLEVAQQLIGPIPPDVDNARG